MVVMLYAKGGVAAKMISVVEIVKREIAREGGKWWQYTTVMGNLEERKRDKVEKKKAKKKTEASTGKGAGGKTGDVEMDDGSVSGSDEEEAFEIMQTPFERAIEGIPKVRAVPVMIVYLARIRIDNLKKLHGYVCSNDINVSVSEESANTGT